MPPQILLFNLKEDLGETVNLADQHPDIVTQLRSLMTELDAEITKNARDPWIKN